MRTRRPQQQMIAPEKQIEVLANMFAVRAPGFVQKVIEIFNEEREAIADLIEQEAQEHDDHPWTRQAILAVAVLVRARAKP